MWRVTEAPWRMLLRSLCCSFAAFSWFWGLVSSQYLISTRWMSRRGLLRSLGRCCLGLVALLVAGGAAEVLPVSLDRTHPPDPHSFQLFARWGVAWCGHLSKPLLIYAGCVITTSYQRSLLFLFSPTWECCLTSAWTYTMLRPMHRGLSMQLYAEWKGLVLSKGFWQASCDVVAIQDICVVSWHVWSSQVWSK